MVEISVNHRRILRVLEKENLWLTFDELYSKVQCDCDWDDFALQLELLVEQGYIQYALFRGMDVGCYQIKGRHENTE